MEQQDTKRRILTEELKLFSTNGYEAVSVEQIARAVGIKAPSLYKHYKSKRDIFDNIIVSMNDTGGPAVLFYRVGRAMGKIVCICGYLRAYARISQSVGGD